MRTRRWALVVSFACLLLPVAVASSQTLQPGFQQSTVFTGLINPTAIKFASDGRVLVAEKGGLIKVFDSLSDTTPDIFADLRTKVHNFWDRGLLGLELHPNFPNTPYVYVLYTLDAAIGATPPRWNDACPNPPGATADGCVVGARLSRLRLGSGNSSDGTEQIFIEDWCQQYPSHSIGSLMFGRDGALYVSGGDGAGFNWVDYGQAGNPLNPCGDPPTEVGGTQTAPTAEGGALRAQDLETAGDPVTMDGAILRLDPITGQAMAGNPLLGGIPDDDRIVAYGFRNPFRITARPGTDEIWVGDVGWNTWEEINRIPSPTAGVLNFGWPCYEGNGRQGGYDGANLNICESLYGRNGAVTAPYYTYYHEAKVASETCPIGGSAISGLAFYAGGAYPSAYDGALFFSDYIRDCIWVMLPGTNGDPDPARLSTFVEGASNPVQLTIGPGGDLFYPDFDGGTIRRIQYHGPTAVATATPTSGPAPLIVNFDGSGSSDPDNQALTYDWDLDGDGNFGDSAAVNPTFTYAAAGNYTVRLRVTDSDTLSDTAILTISASNSPPTPVITAPASTLTWRVAQQISFSGSATDPEDGPEPASRLTWTLVMQHCPSNCHEHVIQTFVGVASGSFTAPDHEYPSYLELRLTAHDAAGASNTTSVSLYPETVDLTFATNPTGLNLSVGPSTQASPFVRTVIIGSTNSLGAPSPQSLSGTSYSFSSWSDNGAQTHDVVAPAAATTYTATYHLAAPPTISIADASATEGNSGASSLAFTVLLSSPSSQTIMVQYATTAGTATAGVDYSTQSGQLTFNPGQTSATLTVPILADTVDEANETVFVTLSFPVNATLGDDSAQGTIVDDDATPTLSVTDVSVTEGNGGSASPTMAVFSVSLSAASSFPVTVGYATVSGSAAAGADFMPTSGSVSIAAGSRTATFSVSIIGDTVKESAESFTVTLSAPSNATIFDGTGLGKIMDDDKGKPR